MRFWLFIGLLGPVVARAVGGRDGAPGISPPRTKAAGTPVTPAEHRNTSVDIRKEALEIMGIDVNREHRAGLHAVAQFVSISPTASDPAADSAIIYGVETLPAAFVVDPEGLGRHIQGGSGQKRHGTGGDNDLGDDRNFL